MHLPSSFCPVSLSIHRVLSSSMAHENAERNGVMFCRSDLSGHRIAQALTYSRIQGTRRAGNDSSNDEFAHWLRDELKGLICSRAVFIARLMRDWLRRRREHKTFGSCLRHTIDLYTNLTECLWVWTCIESNLCMWSDRSETVSVSVDILPFILCSWDD